MSGLHEAHDRPMENLHVSFQACVSLVLNARRWNFFTALDILREARSVRISADVSPVRPLFSCELLAHVAASREQI